MSNLLRRQGIVCYGGKAWTRTHLVSLRAQQFDPPGLSLAFDAEHEAVLQAEARRDRLHKAITAMAAGSEYTPVVHRLGCLPGVSTLTAFGLAVEVGDWDRLTGASIGAYLGLVPTESSSAQSRSQGWVTKTGNTHARRPLVEAAWQHLKPYRTSGATMKARWELAPAAARPPADTPANSDCTSGGWPSPTATRNPSSPTSRSPASRPAELVPGRYGRLTGQGRGRTDDRERAQAPWNPPGPFLVGHSLSVRAVNVLSHRSGPVGVGRRQGCNPG